MSDKVIGKVYLSQEDLNGIFDVIREMEIQNMFNSLDEFPVNDILEEIDREKL